MDPRGEADNQLTEPTRPTSSPCLSPLTPHREFAFPPLNLDGSVDLITLKRACYHGTYKTPPAVLSGLGARMAEQAMSSSVGSLDDGSYDMVDDVSEFSSDGRDTVSIASTDGNNEQELDDEEVEDESAQNTLLASTGLPMPVVHAESREMDEQQVFKVRLPLQLPGVSESQSELIHNTDDLETPRQSTMAAEPTSARSGLLTPMASLYTLRRPASVKCVDTMSSSTESGDSTTELRRSTFVQVL